MNADRHEARAQRALRNFTKRLCDVAGFDTDQSERAAAAVLCALEQRLIVGERQHLEAQLPSKLVELVRRCPFHELRARDIDRPRFLELVAEDLGGQLEPERCVRAVFLALSELLSAGEVVKVARQLPKELRALWPEPVQDAVQSENAAPPLADIDVQPISERQPWDDLRDAALQLPLNAQLGLFYALSGPLFRALSPSERRAVLHALHQDADEITEDENVFGEGAPMT